MPSSLSQEPPPPFRLLGRDLLPIVQGGMGVGVSAHRLAGTVASYGAMGTLASVDLRRLHPDLMAATGRSRDKAAIDGANLAALDREIRGALALAGGRGVVAVNIMRAVSEYAAYVRQACESGAQALVVGAGLPLDLPDLAGDHPGVALVPILSDARGIAVLMRKWLRRGRVPDAIVVEHPRYAGGHLGAARVEDLGDPRFDLARVVEEAQGVFRELGVPPVPLIAAGGIDSREKMRAALALGAAAVQLGTPFAVTEESAAHPVFKRVLAEARPEDIVEFTSVAGLPARAVRTPWLERYLAKLPRLAEKAMKRSDCTLAFDCLATCGLRDGIAKLGQFCIDFRLAAALAGDYQRGLFFRGAGILPFGAEIRPVGDLLDYFLAPAAPG
jgi:nitronate monooxygenase